MNEEDACHHGKLTMEYNGEEERVEDSTRRNNIADNGAHGITFLITQEKTEWRRKGKGVGSCWRAIVVSVFWIDITTRREAPHPSEGKASVDKGAFAATVCNMSGGSAKSGMKPGIRYVAQMLKEWGPIETMKKVFRYDEVKLGVLKGEDYLGNKYYEETSCQHGRHRWVEYNPKYGWNWDPTRIPPEWHGWLTHMTDSTISNPSTKRGMQNNWASNVPNASEHEGTITIRQDINPSVVRTRGYGVGSVFHQFEKGTTPGEGSLNQKNLAFFSIPDDGLSPNKGKYWTQKGSPLSDKHEPMELKIHSWDPSNPTGKGSKVTDRARDLTKL
jgi:NADH:ubiquinone oxidoreductase subunit